MRRQVDDWRQAQITDERAKLILYAVFVDGKLEAPRTLLPDVHRLYFQPEYEEFSPPTMRSLSNAFTSAFKEMDPIPQFKATAKSDSFRSQIQAQPTNAGERHKITFGVLRRCRETRSVDSMRRINSLQNVFTISLAVRGSPFHGGKAGANSRRGRQDSKGITGKFLTPSVPVWVRVTKCSTPPKDRACAARDSKHHLAWKRLLESYSPFVL
jgi:hypothetical protein